MLAAALHAGEVTVEFAPFVIHQSFPATALPDDVVLFSLKAEAWSDFEIKTIAAHGSKVAKGDVLLEFDTESIDRKIADSRNALEVSRLALAQAELDLKQLKETSPYKLEALKRSAAEAKEANEHFIEIRRKADEEKIEQSLIRYRQQLENAAEELRQLTKMYEADDLTEETEEIILTRQKNAVEAAEFALRMEILDQKRMLEVMLPREAVQLAEADRDAALLLAKAEQDIPRAIQIKELELEAMKTAFVRDGDTLKRLEADRADFAFKAPAEGWLYHGSIENGRWTLGDMAKTLVARGNPPIRKPLVSFIPAAGEFALTAFLDEATARGIGRNKPAGSAEPAGREDLSIPVTLTSLMETPNGDGLYRADFKAEWPKDMAIAPGATATIRLIIYQSEKAIVLPENAFTYGADDWAVSVKLADGKTERRKVKRGRVFDKQAEVLSGLEPGQVILLP
jgi:multidrug efflux pump subunit AcrA (membrane-fusion protein)